MPVRIVINREGYSLSASGGWSAIRRIAEPLSILIVTRLVLLLISYATVILVPYNDTYATTSTGSLDPIQALVQWDSRSFLSVVRHGYWSVPITGGTSPSVLPLFPFLIAIVTLLVGNPVSAGFLISNVAFAIALIVLYREAENRSGRSAAAFACLFAAVLPYSFLYSVPYPLSLTLLLTLLAFKLAERRTTVTWVWASVLTAGAALTASAGLAVWVAMLALAYRRWVALPRNWRALVQIVPALAITPLAIGALAIYLRDAAHLPTSQIREIVFGLAPRSLVPLTTNRDQFLFGLNLLLALLLLASTPRVVAKIGRPGAWFQVALVALTLATNPTAMGATLLLAFPFFLVAGDLLRGDLARTIAVSGSSLFLTLFAVAFVGSYSIGGSLPVASEPTRIELAIVTFHSMFGRVTHLVTHPPPDLALVVDESLAVLAEDVPKPRYSPGEVISMPLYLYVLKTPVRGYLVSARLYDRTGKEWARSERDLGGHADAALFDPSQSNAVLEGQYLQEDVSFRLDPGLPSGIYSIDVLFFSVPGFERLMLAGPRETSLDRITYPDVAIASATDLGTVSTMPIAHPIHADIGAALALSGYDFRQERTPTGVDAQISLYWEARTQPERDYTVFVQVLDSSGKLVAQSDSYPANGRYPTSALRTGDVLRDTRVLHLANDVASGPLRVIAGMYLLETMQRLPVHLAADSTEADHVDVVSFGIPS